MNILFLTMNSFKSIDVHNIYSDLMQEFIRHGHRPYIVTPRQKRLGEDTELVEFEDYGLLKVQIGNTSGVGLIEKGISTVALSDQFYSAVKKFLGNKEFGLILYSTPPITLAEPVRKFKKLFGCPTYLMLKDIFPQNAVDLGMFSRKSPIYAYFSAKEKKLYAISDRIGCMSQANVDYVLQHNPEVDPAKVEICPNTAEIRDQRISPEERTALRKKYGIPLDKKVFIYGGNLGKPQGIPFIMECLKAQRENPDAYFLIVGDGTEYKKLAAFFEAEKLTNAKLMKRLPKEDYDKMAAACDVGLIFLDHRFTIPNFPSRLLSCLQAGLPVLCCTDPNTDIGKVCVEGGFGWWCESNDVAAFSQQVENALVADLNAMGENGFAYMQEHYSVRQAYETIMRNPWFYMQ